MDLGEAGAGKAPRPVDTTRTNTTGAAGQTQQSQQHMKATIGKLTTNYAHDTRKQPATTTRLSFGMQSDGATSPERRAQSVPIDPHRTKLRHNHNKFQLMAEHNNADSDSDRDKVRGGSLSGASSSKGSRKH
jgi:hypothetical protein